MTQWLSLEALAELWLHDKRKEKPFVFCAKADPKRVKAQMAERFDPNGYSCVIGGERLFFFEQARARDAFCKAYRAEPYDYAAQ